MKLKANLLDEKAIKRSLVRISHEIIERNKGVEDVVLIGVERRGYPLALRIAKQIESIEKVELKVGSLNVTPYRDDIGEEFPKIKGIKLDIDVKDKIVIIVDDVLFTCRTVRAAMEAIIDNGRPKSIQLAVLIDRGHKELPIRADYIGKNIPTSADEIIKVNISEVDNEDSVIIYEK